MKSEQVRKSQEEGISFIRVGEGYWLMQLSYIRPLRPKWTTDRRKVLARFTSCELAAQKFLASFSLVWRDPLELRTERRRIEK
jgi:hypothetical protein